ncbi:ABC transporter permease [Peterkaempfera bronchialis]|uniref:Sugar ABC transporter permease n=1 Tax=Peterkaempfera bronchialis TaxID=2126346 RepID=A0A345T6U9_9ACTN|nr:ABC transporter permease subunit [Peterkaempfera bronchialis]AXI81704.1 sugar ABC transporter permease [Peterkaempfera bronchialis]
MSTRARTAPDQRKAATVPPQRSPAAGRRTAAPAKGITRWQRFRRDRVLLLMCLPALGLVLVFNYIPLLGNVVAFQEYDPYSGGISGSPWVGFANFQRIFEDSLFWDAVANTLTLTSVQLVLYFPIPILLALLLNSVLSSKVRTAVQSVLYLPHFFSWVLVITVFQQMLGGAGLIAQNLRQHGIEGFDLMTDPGLFKFLLTAQAVWKDAGWGVIVFLAALSAVNQDLYEAAAVDGAGRLRRMWHVTLPALRPVIALLLVLRVGDALTVGFEQILLQRDAVGTGASEVLDTYVWFVGIRTGDFSYAAAAGLVKGLFSLAMVLLANKAAHKLGEQGVYAR